MRALRTRKKATSFFETEGGVLAEDAEPDGVIHLFDRLYSHLEKEAVERVQDSMATSMT